MNEDLYDDDGRDYCDEEPTQDEYDFYATDRDEDYSLGSSFIECGLNNEPPW